MKDEKKFEEVKLELEETTALNLRRMAKINEEAIHALSAFAQPTDPIELVRPPRSTPTTIYLEVDPRFLTLEIRPASESRAARKRRVKRELHWLELVALGAVTGLTCVKLGVLDLASLWT